MPDVPRPEIDTKDFRRERRFDYDGEGSKEE